MAGLPALRIPQRIERRLSLRRRLETRIAPAIRISIRGMSDRWWIAGLRIV
jgi:hypothetical protein